MGKIVEKVKLWSVMDRTRSVEVDAVVDTGATMVVMPQDLVDRLALTKLRDVRAKYGNGAVEKKWVYRAVSLEIQGRSGTFDVLAEPRGSQPLIGLVVLELLDLVVDPKQQRLIPNPASPDAPMVEVLGHVHQPVGHNAR